MQHSHHISRKRPKWSARAETYHNSNVYSVVVLDCLCLSVRTDAAAHMEKDFIMKIIAVESDIETWESIHDFLLLGLRQPLNGVKRAAVIQFVIQLGGMLASSGSTTAEQINRKYEDA